MAIFHLNHSLDIVNQKLKEFGEHKGYKSKLSKVMGIQRAHFSQILVGKLQLTPDHGARLCEEWHFNKLETEYFLNLIYLERAASNALRKNIGNRLDEIRGLASKGHVQQVIVSNSQNFTNADRFFSSWIYPAVYSALQMPDLKGEMDIALRLDLSPNVVHSTLLDLQQMQIIRSENGEWTALEQGFTHSSRTIQAIMHAEMRRKAHEVYICGDSEIIRVSTLSVIPSRVFSELKDKIHNFVEQYHQETNATEKNREEMVVFNVDFFRIGRSRLSAENDLESAD